MNLTNVNVIYVYEQITLDCKHNCKFDADFWLKHIG